MEPTVAIITRTRNRPLLLKRAIHSVLKQSWPYWVHVIVNDGGNPGEVEAVVGPYRAAYEGRLLIVTHPQSLGMEAASNAGIRVSSSDYVIIHDDDDSLEPDFLSETVAYLEAPPLPQVQGVVTLTTRIDEEIVDDTVRETGRRLYKSMEGCIRIDDMASLNSFPPISFLFRRHVLDEVGWFDEHLPVLGDWDFNLRFIMKHDIGVIPKALANYHHRPAIRQGQMGNTVHAQADLHAFYDMLVRNRYIRMTPSSNIGTLMLRHHRQDLLIRLYRHPVIGRVIRLWSRWVNPNIPAKLL